MRLLSIFVGGNNNEARKTQPEIECLVTASPGPVTTDKKCQKRKISRVCREKLERQSTL